jgi:sugar/nucleoside kinase (ribokinase family)
MLAFNPGTLQIEGKERLIFDLISVSEYLFVNKEEAEHLLYGNDINLPNEEKDIKKLLFGLKSLGAKNVLITDSERGSFLNDRQDNSYHLDIVKVKVADKTGAGDGYNAGFIAAVLENKSLQDAMVWGTINSAGVIEKIGAESGLLKKDELEEKKINLNNFYPTKL